MLESTNSFFFFGTYLHNTALYHCFSSNLKVYLFINKLIYLINLSFTLSP